MLSYYTKGFLSNQRLLSDLEARAYMPAWAIPKLFSVNTHTLTADYEYFSQAFSLKTLNDLINLVDFIHRVHLHLEREIKAALKENRAADIPSYKDPSIDALNDEIFTSLGIRNQDNLPVKIGDLKPEHLFQHGQDIKVCDYETAGIGLLLEDMAFLHICCEKTPHIDILKGVSHYLCCRFQKSGEANLVAQAMDKTVTYLASKIPFMEPYRHYWKNAL